MAKYSISQKGEKNKKGLILTIVILIIASIIAIYFFSLPKKENYKEYYKGKFMTINESANLIDLIEGTDNIVFSPYNLYTSINYLYKGTDNNSTKQIKTYTTYNIDDYNTLITKMSLNNTLQERNTNDITNYYEELMTNFFNNKYDKLTVEEIKNMNDKEPLLIQINKINTTLDNINGKNTYDKKYINNLTAKKEDLTASSYQIRTYIDKILDNYDSYLNNEEIINFNKLYLNNKYYDSKILNDNYKDTNLIDFDNDENVSIINNELKKISNNNIKYYLDENILNTNDNIYINSLIFNMEWEENINVKNNSTIEFTTLDKQEIVIDTMTTTVYSYLDNGYATGFIKKFKNNKYSFIAILPNNNDDLTLSNLNLKSLIKSEKTTSPVLVTIPKFNYQSEINLNDIYIKIGLSDLTNSKANFNNFMPGFNLDYNKQKNTINIGEKGTYNSDIATQELETFTKDADQLEIILNRPFAYIIMNNETNEILLIGKVYKP